MARFVPIIRTFAPFVAGIGKMPLSRFIGFSVAGGVFWVTVVTIAGLCWAVEAVKTTLNWSCWRSSRSA